MHSSLKQCIGRARLVHQNEVQLTVESTIGGFNYSSIVSELAMNG